MKTNIEVLAAFEQMSGTRINKLIWLAADVEGSEVNGMLEDVLDSASLPGVFPDIPERALRDYDGEGDKSQLLYDYRKFGFLAQVLSPDLSDFSFREDGTPKSWGYRYGCSTVSYVYAETTDELVDKIKAIATDHFNYCVDKFKEKASDARC